MEKIEELKDKLETSRPEDWELIPDIDLYMLRPGYPVCRSSLQVDKGGC